MTKRAKAPRKRKAKAKAKSKSRLDLARAQGRVIRRDPAWLERIDPLDPLIDASARALALPLDPTWKGAIRTNLDVNLRMAAAFADFPLPDDAEPAPVFTA